MIIMYYLSFVKKTKCVLNKSEKNAKKPKYHIVLIERYY